MTRGVLEEGQQHFANERQALAWIDQPWHRGRAVYNSEGLYVLFAKLPERSQINVDVFQIYIAGKRPTSLLGAQDDKVSLYRAGSREPRP